MARKKSRKPATRRAPNADADARLVDDVRSLIDTARAGAVTAVNASLTTLYWRIGHRIHEDILGAERVAYGAEVIASLGRELERERGRGFGEKNLRRMVPFVEAFPDWQIVISLIRQLSWTHFIALIPLKEPLAREFYAEMCRLEGWSVRALRRRIDGMLFERTVLSRKPEALIRQELAQLRANDTLTPDFVLKDPYLLDFLGLADTWSERDLEAALLREIERFLLELGDGFAFVERQKRLVVDGRDYYVDLVFYHRRLRRLVAAELKLGAFTPAVAGQVELYLRWLDRHDRQPGEEAPIALVLCTERNDEMVRILDLDRSGIHVAEYLTELPPQEVLQSRFEGAIVEARSSLRDDTVMTPQPERSQRPGRVVEAPEPPAASPPDSSSSAPDPDELATALVEARCVAGLSMKEAASAANVTVRTYRRWVAAEATSRRAASALDEFRRRARRGALAWRCIDDETAEGPARGEHRTLVALHRVTRTDEKSGLATFEPEAGIRARGPMPEARARTEARRMNSALGTRIIEPGSAAWKAMTTW